MQMAEVGLPCNNFSTKSNRCRYNSAAIDILCPHTVLWYE